MRFRATITATALALVGLASGLSSAQAASSSTNTASGRATPYSFVVIGDQPYGSTQLSLFPSWISKINASNPVMTFHVGDIKYSERRCDSAYMTKILGLFNKFSTALIYTPGDNEWTDCSQPVSGGYNPLERLTKLRSVMYPVPGRSLGKAPIPLSSQSTTGFPENVRLVRDGIVFTVVHVVGENDDLLPWAGRTAATPAQRAEQAKRMASAIHTIEAAFSQAKDTGARAVAIFLHVDMFDPTKPVDATKLTAYKPLVQTLINQTNQYKGQVYLFNGDSHEFNNDYPLKSGSKWLSIYGVKGYSTKFQRITVDGDLNVKSFLKVTANASATGPALTWVALPLS
jgi:hypothetical protein